MTETKKPMVAVWMVAYNHERYIERAIRSVMDQQTNFPFKLFIGEDCSKDNTRRLCLAMKEAYGERIELILQNSNTGGMKNAQDVYHACRDSGARYIAIVEGDDFWLDRMKLQKQVTLLEERPDLSLIGTEAIVVDEHDAFASTKIQAYSKTEFSISDCIYPFNNLTTCSVIYRNIPGLDYSFIFRYKPVGDWPLWIKLLLEHKGGYAIIPEVMAAYRVHSGGVYSASANTIKYKKGLHLLDLFYTDFPPLHQTIKKSIGYHARMLINTLQQEGKRLEMIRVYLKYRSYPEFNTGLRDLIYKLRHRS